MNDGPEQAYAAIQGFLAAAREPHVYEPGHKPIPLLPEQHEVRFENGRLTVHAWSAEDNLVRRITGIQRQAAGQIDLSIERFGKRSGTLHFVDRAHRKSGQTTRRAVRLVFRERFQRSLLRQFPGWRIAELSTEPDLEHSLSPAYARAFVRKGTAGFAAIGAPPEGSDPDAALTFGLIWLDYLRRRESRVAVESLVVFLPEGTERTTCLRLRELNPEAGDFAVFVYSENWEQRIDIADGGNMDTRLPVRESHFVIPDWLDALSRVEGVEKIDHARDNISWRVRGLEFARWNGSEILFGLETRHKGSASNRGEIETLAREITRMRSPLAGNRVNPLYAAAPERWLESQIRKNIHHVGAALMNEPVYGQVPSFAAADRSVLDLLASECDGRLAVVEVKASEDLHLPLQALDYWMRVAWHAAQDDFSARGYFPGLTVSRRAPRLYLVAPALCFHPTTETILRFLRPQIEVERIGVSMDWRSRFKVVFRARGAEETFRWCDDRTEDCHDESGESPDPGT